jgi:HEAT repeat protein
MPFALSDGTRKRIQKHIALLNSPDGAISQQAERSLIRFGHKAVEQVLTITSIPDPQVRFRAVWVLDKSQDVRALPAIIQLTDDPDARVRYDAVLALGELGYQEAVPLLEKLAQQPEDPASIESAACMALAKLGIDHKPGAA